MGGVPRVNDQWLLFVAGYPTGTVNPHTTVPYMEIHTVNEVSMLYLYVVLIFALLPLTQMSL